MGRREEESPRLVIKKIDYIKSSKRMAAKKKPL